MSIQAIKELEDKGRTHKHITPEVIFYFLSSYHRSMTLILSTRLILCRFVIFFEVNESLSFVLLQFTVILVHIDFHHIQRSPETRQEPLIHRSSNTTTFQHNHSYRSRRISGELREFEVFIHKHA